MKYDGWLEYLIIFSILQPLLFPPKFYDYLSKEMGKQVILVLNKIDLSPAALVLAWKDYFTKTYPGVEVLCFTSFPSYNLHGNVSSKGVNKVSFPLVS
jgi:ribosome biogenesis GTPase A